MTEIKTVEEAREYILELIEKLEYAYSFIDRDTNFWLSHDTAVHIGNLEFMLKKGTCENLYSMKIRIGRAETWLQALQFEYPKE